MKYMHLRYRWLNDISDSNPQGIDCRGGVTIGIENGHDHDTETCHFTFAICSLNDVFCRKIGRHIVQGRMKNMEYYVVPFDLNNADLTTLFNTYIMPRLKPKLMNVLGESFEEYFEALS